MADLRTTEAWLAHAPDEARAEMAAQKFQQFMAATGYDKNVLRLDRLGLTSLPAELGQCDNLAILYCDHNELAVLPPELGQCADLTILKCNNNRLASLPPELGQCAKLTCLPCWCNPLDDFLQEFPGQSGLEVVRHLWATRPRTKSARFCGPSVPSEESALKCGPA